MQPPLSNPGRSLLSSETREVGLIFVEISEDQPNENSRGCLFGVALAREAATTLALGRDSKAGRGAGERPKGKGRPPLCLDRRLWAWEGGGS